MENAYTTYRDQCNATSIEPMSYFAFSRQSHVAYLDNSEAELEAMLAQLGEAQDEEEEDQEDPEPPTLDNEGSEDPL